MGFEQYHEPPHELPEKTRTFARMIASLIEEAEAIGWVASIDVSDEAAYTKEARAMLGKSLKEEGGKFIVRNGRTAVLEGTPPSKRIIIVQFPDIDKVQAAYKSAAYQEARKAADKYAKFNIFAVEGTAD